MEALKSEGIILNPRNDRGLFIRGLKENFKDKKTKLINYIDLYYKIMD